MESKPLGFALIGAGAVAAHHVRALQQTQYANILAVHRRDKKAGEEFAKQFDLDFRGSMEGVLQDSDIDVVDIVVPSGLHSDLGILAANAGKHVIVEKPIDVNLEKADALIDACQKNGVTLAVISQYRFSDPMLSVYKAIADGELGDLIQGDAYIKWYRSPEYYQSGAWRGTRELDGGGPFINQGIHFIDLLLSVMGPVKWVTAKTKTAVHDINVEDHGMAMLEFTNGAYGIIQASTATFPGLPARLDVHGSRGTVSVEGENLALYHVLGKDPMTDQDKSAGGASSPMAIDVTPFVREFTDIVEAIQTKRNPRVDGVQARRALELILAIYESSKSGKSIKLAGA